MRFAPTGTVDLADFDNFSPENLKTIISKLLSNKVTSYTLILPVTAKPIHFAMLEAGKSIILGLIIKAPEDQNKNIDINIDENSLYFILHRIGNLNLKYLDISVYGDVYNHFNNKDKILELFALFCAKGLRELIIDGTNIFNINQRKSLFGSEAKEKQALFLADNKITTDNKFFEVTDAQIVEANRTKLTLVSSAIQKGTRSAVLNSTT